MSNTLHRRPAKSNTRFEIVPKIFIAAIVAVAWCDCTAAGQTNLLFEIESEPQPAELVKIDEEFSVRFRIDGQETVVPAQRVVHWGTYRDACERHQIFLVDGSVIVADIVSMTEQELVYDSPALGRGRLPSEHIAALNLNPKRDDNRRDRQLDRLLIESTSRQVDRSGEAVSEEAPGEEGMGEEGLGEEALGQVTLSSGDQMPGQLLAIDAQHPDRIRKLTIRVDDSDLQIQLGRITSVRIRAVDRSSVVGGCRLGLADGTLLNVSSLKVVDSGYQLHLAGGSRVQLFQTKQQTGQQIMYFRPVSGRVQFLSDREPVSDQQVPMLSARRSVKRDRCVTGTRLRSNTGVYDRGIGMHANSTSAYEVAAELQWFAAEVAIDQSAGQRGSVVFKVYLLDPNNDWKPAFTSEIIRGGQSPVAIRVKLPQRDTVIALAVEQSADGDVMDRTNWLNARFE